MRLGYEPVTQDIFGTDPGDLRRLLREKIDSCEGLLQIVGAAYGWEPPEADEWFGRVSYSQYEFLYAQRQGKKTWLIVAQSGCQRDKPIHELDLPPGCNATNVAAAYQKERQDLQQKYIDKLRLSNHVYHAVDDEKDLFLKVERFRDDFAQLRKRFRWWQSTVFGMLAVTLVILALVGAGMWWMVFRQPNNIVESLKTSEVKLKLLTKHSELKSYVSTLMDSGSSGLWMSKLATLKEEIEHSELMIQELHYAKAEEVIDSTFLQARRIEVAQQAIEELMKYRGKLKDLRGRMKDESRLASLERQMADNEQMLREGKLVRGIETWGTLNNELECFLAETTIELMDEHASRFNAAQLRSDGGEQWAIFEEHLSKARTAISQRQYSLANTEIHEAQESFRAITLPRILYLSYKIGTRIRWYREREVEARRDFTGFSPYERREILDSLRLITEHPLRLPEDMFSRIHAANADEIEDMLIGSITEFIRENAGKTGYACMAIGSDYTLFTFNLRAERRKLKRIDDGYYGNLLDVVRSSGRWFEYNLEEQYDLLDGVTEEANTLGFPTEITDRLFLLRQNLHLSKTYNGLDSLLKYAEELSNEFEHKDLRHFKTLAKVIIDRPETKDAP